VQKKAALKNAWRSNKSSRGIAQRTAALARAWAWQEAAPRCGAHARTTGEPCRNVALANGRCRLHGGRTPKGSDWHVPQFTAAKLDRKLADLEKRRKKRERRVAAMTPEERERHEAWQRAHKPGGPGDRDRRRRDLEARERFASLEDRPRVKKVRQLAESAAALRRRAAELTAAAAAEAAGRPQTPSGDPSTPDGGDRRPGAAGALGSGTASEGDVHLGSEKGTSVTKKPTDTPATARLRNLRRIQTEGLDAATDAAIALLRDAGAPAQAKSAMVNSIYRASGLFEKQEPDEDDIDPSEMTAEQLSRSVARFKDLLLGSSEDTGEEDEDEDEDVFG